MPVRMKRILWQPVFVHGPLLGGKQERTVVFKRRAFRLAGYAKIDTSWGGGEQLMSGITVGDKQLAAPEEHEAVAVGT